MGHAGAIVSGNRGTAQAKIDALTKAGARVAQNPTQLGDLMAEALAVGSVTPITRFSRRGGTDVRP